MNKEHIKNYFESLKIFLSTPNKITLKNVINNSLKINKNRYLKQTGGDDVCAICYSNESPFGKKEEELYSHIREEPFYKDNKYIVTNCKLHKSCLEQYIHSKYDGPLIEKYPIKCPVCNSALIYSKIINIKEEGSEKETPVFELVTLDNLPAPSGENNVFNFGQDARANLNAIIITTFFIIVSYFILQYRNQTSRINESNINSEQQQINILVNNYISELFENFQNSEISINEQSLMQMVESLNQRIEELLGYMEDNDLPELSQQLGGKKHKKRKTKKTKKLKKIKKSKKTNKMIKK